MAAADASVEFFPTFAFVSRMHVYPFV